jgi:hypothetical protein
VRVCLLFFRGIGLFPESGDLDDLAAPEPYVCEPEPPADQKTVGEKLLT